MLNVKKLVCGTTAVGVISLDFTNLIKCRCRCLTCLLQDSLITEQCGVACGGFKRTLDIVVITALKKKSVSGLNFE